MAEAFLTAGAAGLHHRPPRRSGHRRRRRFDAAHRGDCIPVAGDLSSLDDVEELAAGSSVPSRTSTCW
ncbi:MAG: hypothetical protein R2695_08915 [Acidimicrobiales bacterium]